MNDQPIFQDAGHALHVSFLIHSMPAGSRSPTAIVIDQLVKENHVWDELPSPAKSRVNFEGLSPMEVRAQAAQVVSMVNNMPQRQEACAVKAIYGHQVIKAEGVRGMAQYLEPLLGRSSDYALYVAWHVFMRPHQRQGVTQGDIGQRFGVTTAQVVHDCRKMRQYGQSLHARALDALTERFALRGSIGGAPLIALETA